LYFASLDLKYASLFTMCSCLRSEISSLQRDNDELRQNLQSAETDRRGLASKAEGSDASLAYYQARIQDLIKANDALVKEVFKYRHETSKQRRKYQSNNVQTAAKLTNTEKDLHRMTASRETEVKALTNTLKESQKQFHEEKKALKYESSLLKEKHSGQVRKLREELQITQESHQEYLTKLMDVLETTHAMREEETTKISAELLAVKREKDNQIMGLQQEVKALRAMKKGGLRNIRAAVDSRFMQKSLGEGSDSRAHRSAQFDDIAQGLQSLVAETSALPADVSEEEMENVVAQQERGQKMAELIDTLGHLYKMEEDSQHKTSQASLELVEEYVAVTEPNRTLQEMKERLANMELETSRLREELREKETCRRCAVRDSAARRRIHGAE
jgi:DNA repair exonuclease SbcCD ATPase subunit